jgi:threonine dehydratase
VGVTRPHLVYDVALRSPLTPAVGLSAALGCEVHLKREDLQPVHSFKIRGAYNKLARLSPAERARGALAASAGNHAQGVAVSARHLGTSATVVMPTTTPTIKVAAVAAQGAEVVLHGDSYADAYAHCRRIEAESGKVFVHPYDDLDVIDGQGTIADELLDDLPGLTHVFVPVGGGGLIAGIASRLKRARPAVRVIGVEPEDSDAMAASLAAGRRVVLPHVGLFADGVAVAQVGERTFALAQRHVDAVITVTTDEICAAIKAGFEETRTILEPAGALGIAGAVRWAEGHDLAGARVAAICSGANMTFERLQFVAERTLFGSRREALFVVTLPEVPGALRRFCTDVVGDRSITQFNHRLAGRGAAHVLVGAAVAGEDDRRALVARMDDLGYEHLDVTGDDIAKEHLRHMVGGPSPAAEDERLYEIQFPERPRALADFLRTIGERWNISAFHYRGLGGDVGRVLIGFEAHDAAALEDGLAATGYEFARISSVAAELLLGADRPAGGRAWER